jgi:AMP nucleosidase
MSKRQGAPANVLVSFTDARAAVDRITQIYQDSTRRIRDAYAHGGEFEPGNATYPYLTMTVRPDNLHLDATLSHGIVLDPGSYATTLTRPDIFGAYYEEQIAQLLEHHRVPVSVVPSDRVIPLPFAVSEASAATETDQAALLERFLLPDLALIDDAIANGTFRPQPGEPRPLALFTAERVDYSLQRLKHYTGTDPAFFQRFLLLTNYDRYVSAFRAFGLRAIAAGKEFETLVEPGDRVLRDGTAAVEPATRALPQMPAWHLTRPDGDGITLVNIGVGPSNAKTITDHLAVLRPHCWIMLGHCAGLRRTQQLGDYVLAHAYARDDGILEKDLPAFIPLPPIAEVQVALLEAISKVTGLKGPDLRTRVRTGTVATTNNRNWELRYAEYFERLNQARAIAIDMESSVVAGAGFRFRVPYGTLLCVSDKPAHGTLKTREGADAFYRERVSQHLVIGIETMRILRGMTSDLHSRKLRSFDEPAFR